MRESETISQTEKESTLPKERVTTTHNFEEFTESYKRMVGDEGMLRIFETGPNVYKRYAYPELVAREREISKLVGVEEGEVVLYNSGMAAIRDSIESLGLTKGDIVLYSPSMYGETIKYIEENLKNREISVVPIDSGNLEDIKNKIDHYHPKLLIAETVGNAPEMPVLNTKELFKKVEETNQEYQEKFNLKTILSKQLLRRGFVKQWLQKEEGKELTPEQREKLSSLVEDFEQTTQKVNKDHSYIPLRSLIKKMEEEGIEIQNRRATLLELKSITDTSWLTKREEPMSIILDNTLPTPSGLPLGKKIKESQAPIMAVESGTKFYAHDKGTIGVAYSNSPEKILELKLLRMRSGTYLPGAVEKTLPEFQKEKFEVRNKTILKNTKSLAETISRLKGRIGIKAVSHPNLPEHPNYEYASQNFSEGASALFYVLCEDSLETARVLAEKLGDQIEFGGSFGFEKTRFLPLPGGILRIAGGNESPEELEKILEKIIELEKRNE